MAESGGVLASGDRGSTRSSPIPCASSIRELLSYETATLTSANHYALTTLYRGLYGSDHRGAFVRRAVRAAR